MSKLVVITGVTRGLGRAMARGFAEAGQTVAGCGRGAEHIVSLTLELGAPHRFEVLDVISEGVDAWAGRVKTALGVPDLLINNAALINRPADLWQITDAEFSRLIDVNVKGVFRVSKAFLPAMVRRGTGVVVNFSSGWGRSTSARVAPYCASKWAIEGMTGALAQELPSGMAAVALNPGVINTDMLQTAWGDGADAYAAADVWARRAVPFLLGLGAADNGRQATVPS